MNKPPSARATSRGSHAERSARTREQVLGAASELVRSGGLQAASMFEVAKAAGVTPGALQHHFGTKAELMMQLVEHLLAGGGDSSVAWPPATQPLRRRTQAFVQTLWQQVYLPPRFLAAWAVYFGSSGDGALMARIAERRRAVNVALHQRLLEVFPELAARRDSAALADLVFAALRGLAMTRLFNAADSDGNEPGADDTEPARRELARLIEARCAEAAPSTPAKEASRP